MKPVHGTVAVLLLFASGNVWAVGGEADAIESGLAQRSDVVGFWGFEVGGDDGAFCVSSPTTWRTHIYGAAWGPTCDRNTIVEGEESFSGKTRKITYPAGTFGPADNGDNWPMAFDRIPSMPQSRFDSLHLRYYLRFDSTFDYQMGGKLPGLVGGNNWSRSGGNHPDGTNGWTTRYMWKQEGRPILYAYLPPEHNPAIMKSAWGSSEVFDYENGGMSRTMERGIWHCIEQFVKINDVGKANGVIKCWLNGELSLVLDDVTFRTVANGEAQVGAVYFSTFHGGNSADWAPDTTSFIYFDNLVLAQGYVGPVARAPVVSLTRPAAGRALSQGEYLTASATSSTPVTAMRFYLNGVLSGVDSTAPYEHTTYLATPGTMLVRARAVTADRLLVGSEPVSVTVAARTAPTPDTILKPIHDAYVRGGSHASENHGSESTLVIKSSADEDYVRESYLKFDLSGIGGVSSARLRLYCTTTDRPIVVSADATEDNGWTESSLTWHDRPRVIAPIAWVAVEESDAWCELDLTGYAAALGGDVTTLSLRIHESSSAGAWTQLASSEARDNGPLLEIVEGTAGGGTPGNVLAGPGTPVVSRGPSGALHVRVPDGGRATLWDIAGRQLWRSSTAGMATVAPATVAGLGLLRVLGAEGSARTWRVMAEAAAPRRR